LPFFVALAITAINSEYMSPLWHTLTGQKLIGLGLVMMACGASMLRKIVSFRG
jgi:Flp pilus assembly protein TadB